jgi:hypothetical protein
VLALILAAVIAPAQAATPTRAEQLQDAARKGDAAAVRKLLDDGVDVNTRFRYNATALFYACDHGHVDVVRLLLDRGADVNIKDTFYGFTPMALALEPAQKKKPEHTEIAKLLIARGAAGYEAALGTAVDENDAGLLKAALDKGGIAAPALSDALEAAKAANKTAFVALLEQAGAKPYEDFKIDPAQLARFAGTYKNAPGTVQVAITVAGARLSAALSTGPRLTLIAQDAKTFKALGRGGMTVAFQIDGEKVSGFTLNPPQGGPVPFTRVEDK